MHLPPHPELVGRLVKQEAVLSHGERATDVVALGRVPAGQSQRPWANHA